MELILKYFPDLSPEQCDRFAAMYDLYADWNAKINVVSRKDFDQLYLRHVLHSLAIARVCRFDAGARILDVGCGGGFPSVPLAVLFPEAHFVAADSIRKKITVVEGVRSSLGLTNLEARCVRVEQLTERFASPPSPTPTPEERFINLQQRTQLEHYLEQLTPRYRELIRMRFFDEYSYEEIATKLGLPLGTVKTQIHRAREQMCRLIARGE